MISKSRFGLVQLGIILTALATAFIHAWIASQLGGFLFYLNALGYIGLTVLLLLPGDLIRRVVPQNLAERYRPIIRWIFIGYTLLTIVLWVVMGTRSTLAYVDKIIEVVLLALLWLDRSRD
jgi:hypothetical protein